MMAIILLAVGTAILYVFLEHFHLWLALLLIVILYVISKIVAWILRAIFR